MLSGNKLEKAYACSMAVVEDWSSWDVPEHWIEGWHYYLMVPLSLLPLSLWPESPLWLHLPPQLP
jgi:hypothetical protein